MSEPTFLKGRLCLECGGKVSDNSLGDFCENHKTEEKRALEGIERLPLQEKNKSIKLQPASIEDSESQLLKVFDRVKKTLKHFVELPNEQAYDFLTVWIMGTHCFDSFETFPYIALQANKGCGKTKVLTLIEKLSARGMLFISPTVATVFRAAHAQKPTLCFDELEFMGDDDSKDLRALLYSGYKRGATVPRSHKDAKPGEPPFLYSVYCPKAFASIRSLPGTMLDRCILVQLHRSLNPSVANKNVPTENFKFEDGIVSWKGINNIIATEIKKIQANIEMEYANFPEDNEIVGRPWELWQPLFVIGKICGVYGNLRNYAFELLKLKAEEESVEFPATILNTLRDFSILPDGRWISNRQILEKINSMSEWFNVRSSYLGATMRNLGFKARHTREGAAYFVKPQQIELEAKRIGIILGDVRDVGDVISERPPASSENINTLINVPASETASPSSQPSQSCRNPDCKGVLEKEEIGWRCKKCKCLQDPFAKSESQITKQESCWHHPDRKAHTSVPDALKPGAIVWLCEECFEK